MDDSTILCFIARHGVTGLNQDNRFRGNKDVPLNAEGLADAHKLATMFENIDLSAIVCSDRIRATKTAEIIAQRKGTKIHKSENLRAWNVGMYSGMERNKENTAAVEHYVDNPDEVIPEGESLNQFKDRVRPCINEAIDIAEETGKPILVVAHSSVIHETGDMLYSDHHKVLVAPGGVIAIYHKDGRLEAEPIHRPVKAPKSGAITVS